MIRTVYCTAVYLFELLYGSIIGLIIKLLPDKNGKKEAWFHRIIQKSMKVDVNHIWGVKFNVHNDVGETFEKSSIIICNHLSMLDPIYLLSLSPRIIVMASDKVWHNVLVRTMFKVSRFLNASGSVEEIEQKIGKSLEEGYSVVIFPEGLRSDGDINRFHKGAFYLSKTLGVDILPIYIHGTGHVMPKGSGFASRGQVDLMIGERISSETVSGYGDTAVKITKSMQRVYQSSYKAFQHQIENTHYFHDFVINKHIYKGIGIEKETRQLLKRYDDFSKWIDDHRLDDPSSKTVSVVHAGRGQFSLMMALVHPEWEIHSYTDDPDDFALASACEPKPDNLHIHQMTEADTDMVNIIDFSNILKG